MQNLVSYALDKFPLLLLSSPSPLSYSTPLKAPEIEKEKGKKKKRKYSHVS
jgi:hypothetical protein